MTNALDLHRDSSGARQNWRQCLVDARGGCRDAQANLFEALRPHLVQRARTELDTRLGIKVAPSDLVQEVLLEACERLPKFRGGTRAEVIAWLHVILEHKSIDAVRTYRVAEKRSIDREELLGQSDPLLGRPEVGREQSPSQHVMAVEHRTLVEQALRRLSANDERVLRLRSQTELTFAEIGRLLEVSEEAARKRWARAAERLGRELKNDAPR